jgi:hypothetical protein
MLGLDLGWRLQYRTGSPMWQGFTNPADGSTLYRSPRGTGFAYDYVSTVPNLNDPSSWVSIRQPDVFIVDMQARYNLGHALGLKNHRIEIVGLVVNILNNQNVTSLSDFYSPKNDRFGLSTFRNSALQGELILRFRN